MREAQFISDRAFCFVPSQVPRREKRPPLKLCIQFSFVTLDGHFAAVEKRFELTNLAVMLVVEHHVFGSKIGFTEEGLDGELFEGVLVVFGSSVLIFQNLDFKFGERTGGGDRFSVFFSNEFADVTHGRRKIACVTFGDDYFNTATFMEESGLQGCVEGQV